MDELKRALDKILTERARLFETEVKPLIDASEGRAMTGEEQQKSADIDARFAQIDMSIRQLRGQIDTEEQRAALGMDGGNQRRRGGLGEQIRAALTDRSNPGLDLAFTSEQFTRALGVGTASDGAGNTIATPFWSEFVQPLRDNVSVIDAGARVIVTASGETMKIPYLKTFGAAEKGKAANASLSGTDPTFGLVDWTTTKYDQVTLAPRELIEDSAIDIEGLVGSLIGDNVGYLVGSDVSTNTATAVTVGKTGTGTDFIPTFDEIVDLEYSIIRRYRNAAKFVASDLTIAGLRKIKDTTGQYLWSPATQEGEPDRLHGKPIIADAFLDAPAADKKTLMYGDFSKVWVRLVGSMRLERSDQAAFLNDQIAFKGVLRAGSAFTDANAVKAFKTKAA